MGTEETRLKIEVYFNQYIIRLEMYITHKKKKKKKMYH
jgi:hypothetical protein